MMRSPLPQIGDVAHRAGVAVSTVSKVLNWPATVSPATRARVQQAINELGYVRNDSARQLAGGSSLVTRASSIPNDRPPTAGES
jgi:LacI family transcriptional regulator, galactose operon repressor